MRYFWPAMALAILQLAGDNVAVVPDLAAAVGPGIMATAFWAYVVCGSVLAGATAWIGAHTGRELPAVAQRLAGCTGKRLLAASLLGVSLPASALTGAYFGGRLLADLSGLTQEVSMGAAVAVFSAMAFSPGGLLLAASNILALLFTPFIIWIAFSTGLPDGIAGGIAAQPDWILVLALLGYNAGGLRSALLVETGARVHGTGLRAVGLAVVAKMIEGVVTLALAAVTLEAGAAGPLAFGEVAASALGHPGHVLFQIVLFAVFMNTMAPAMVVNAKQIRILTGMSFRHSLLSAGLAVWLIGWQGFESLVNAMSISGALMAAFILWTVLRLYKSAAKHG